MSRCTSLNRGAALLELLLFTPLFLFFVTGAFDVAQVMFLRLEVRSALRNTVLLGRLPDALSTSESQASAVQTIGETLCSALREVRAADPNGTAVRVTLLSISVDPRNGLTRGDSRVLQSFESHGLRRTERPNAPAADGARNAVPAGEPAGRSYTLFLADGIAVRRYPSDVLRLDAEVVTQPTTAALFGPPLGPLTIHERLTTEPRQ